MALNSKNIKMEAVTEKTSVIGIEVDSEFHLARAFSGVGFMYSNKLF